MPETENPRTYIQPKPLPITSHHGLKITARNARVYTCEIPNRKEVAKENYERRRHQMTKCGYRSVIYKPYQPVGEVFLNDKKLILSALGQQASEHVTQFQDNSSSSSSDSDSEDEETFRNSKSPTKADQQKPVMPQATLYKPKVINDIRAQVNKGRKMINAVRLGFGLYRLVKDEQEKKQAIADEEQRKKEEAAKSAMKPPSADSSDHSDDEEMDDELKSYMIPLPPSPTPEVEISMSDQFLETSQANDRPGSTASSVSSQRWKRLGTTVTLAQGMSRDQQPSVHVTSVSPPDSPQVPDYDRSSTEHLSVNRTRQVASAPSRRQQLLHPPKSAQSTSSRMSRKSRKLRNPRPYSPVYSNINYNDVADRQSVFRQLCVLNWILEAMSQDIQPTVMPPITSCWKLKDLKENINNLRKRVEKERNAEKDWVSFKQNPARFTQRSTRRGTRRISIHPNFLQRLNNTANANMQQTNTSALRVPHGDTPRSRRGSIASDAASHNENEPAHGQRYGQEEQAPSVVIPTANHARFAEETEVIRPASTPPAPPQTPSTPARGNSADKKVKLQKQKSFTVTAVYTPPANASRAIQKIRAKNRAAKAFKNNLSQKELEKLSTPQEEQQAKSDSRVSAWVQATGAVNTKRFAAAAIAAFGAITLDHHTDKVPTELKTKFEEVAEEKALVLHDNLEVRDRNRIHILERKLMCLETFNNMYRALEQMRSSSVIPDNETNEEMRQRVSEECKWYKDLNDNLPAEVKTDLYCNLVLNRIAAYGSLEGRKASTSQFLKVLSTLRMWEICAPDISAAIEFVREKVVGMSEIEYEDWFNMKFPQPQRAASAPPPRTGGLAY